MRLMWIFESLSLTPFIFLGGSCAPHCVATGFISQEWSLAVRSARKYKFVLVEGGYAQGKVSTCLVRLAGWMPWTRNGVSLGCSTLGDLSDTTPVFKRQRPSRSRHVGVALRHRIGRVRCCSAEGRRQGRRRDLCFVPVRHDRLVDSARSKIRVQVGNGWSCDGPLGE